MEQGSNEWLEWRKQGLGASDAPVIMGISPYTTPYQLWEEKVGLKSGFKGNWATQRGNRLEPQARAHFELENDADFIPTLATHSEFSWLRASLDGFNEVENSILEIKCPGKDDHGMAAAGRIPDKYWPQLQHQFLVTGARKAYYYSFDGSSGHTVECYPDMDYIEGLFAKEKEFWQMVINQQAPKLSAKDVVVVKDHESILLADRYCELVEKQKDLDTQIKSLRKALEKAADHPRTKIGRLSITKTVRTGRVNYKAIPALTNIDLSQYRGKPSNVITFKIDQGE
jgi:putative phage-type endonuclease